MRFPILRNVLSSSSATQHSTHSKVSAGGSPLSGTDSVGQSQQASFTGEPQIRFNPISRTRVTDGLRADKAAQTPSMCHNGMETGIRSIANLLIQLHINAVKLREQTVAMSRLDRFVDFGKRVIERTDPFNMGNFSTISRLRKHEKAIDAMNMELLTQLRRYNRTPCPGSLHRDTKLSLSTLGLIASTKNPQWNQLYQAELAKVPKYEDG